MTYLCRGRIELHTKLVAKQIAASHYRRRDRDGMIGVYGHALEGGHGKDEIRKIKTGNCDSSVVDDEK